MSDEFQLSKDMFSENRAGGNILTIVAGLFFYIVCMLLPLVGQAGRATEHYTQNFLTFAAVLVVASGCAIGGLMFKLKARKEHGEPFPVVSAGLSGIYVLLLASLLLDFVGV